jgi:sugar lactone lactonase YvrE
MFEYRLIFATLFCLLVICQSRYIYNFAGNGLPQGYSGNGGPATKTRLLYPSLVSMSPTGNVYICDPTESVVRIVFTNGTIFTIAGNGIAGYSGNGGPATSAQLNGPFDVAVSTTGEVYIADTNNNVIRVVYTNGIIDTFAGNGTAGYSGNGGPATNAELNYPTGVAISPTGEIYIADTGNNAIRIVYANGTINTIAGNGIAGYSGNGGPATSAQLNGPFGVAVSTTGEVYIADTGNNVIRVVYTNGTIDTIAGNGIAGYSGNGGPATNAELNYPTGVAISPTGTIYIADFYNSYVRQVNVDGIITIFAGASYNLYSGDGGPATSADLYNPFAVVVSATGEVYIADAYNNVIRVVYTNGIIDTFAGNGTAGYSGNGGPAISAQLNRPSEVTVSSTGEIYIADTNNNVIRVVSTNGIIDTFAGNGFAGYSGNGGPAIKAQLNFPYGVAVSSSGEVYIADTSNNVIRLVSTNGIIDTFAGNGIAGYSGNGGPAIKAQLNLPYGVAISSSGEVYIADTFNNVIRIVYTNGNIDNFAGNGTAGYSGNGGPAISALLHVPSKVAVSPTGEVYIGDTNNNVIRVVYTNGTINTIAGNGTAGYLGSGGPATNAELNGPTGVAISPTGAIYIADSNNNRVLNLNCDPNYTGYNCQLSICYGVNETSPFVCSGNGKCVGPNTCKCSRFHYGDNCALFMQSSIAFKIMINGLLLYLLVITLIF